MSNIVAPPHHIYQIHMAEAKLRLLAVERVLNAPTPITGLLSLDSEFCFLQIRKVIELITFSAIKREEARYSKLLEQDQQANPRDHGNPAKDWQAPEILKRLVTLSPHVLPIPISKANRTGSNVVHYERHNMSVNHGRLIELYGTCGGYLHAKNPLVTDYLAQVEAERTKYGSAPMEIRRAQDFLRKLLWQHAVIQLAWSDPDNPMIVDGPGSAWLLDFGATNDEQVTLVIGEAT